MICAVETKTVAATEEAELIKIFSVWKVNFQLTKTSPPANVMLEETVLRVRGKYTLAEKIAKEVCDLSITNVRHWKVMNFRNVDLTPMQRAHALSESSGSLPCSVGASLSSLSSLGSGSATRQRKYSSQPLLPSKARVSSMRSP